MREDPRLGQCPGMTPEDALGGWVGSTYRQSEMGSTAVRVEARLIIGSGCWLRAGAMAGDR
jgi:hypothetical protein